MARFGCLLLIVGTFFTVGGVLYLWESSFARGLIEPYLCQPSEELNLRLFESPTRFINFFCFQDDGDVVRQLNTLSIGAMAAVVLLPVVSFGLMLGGSRDKRKRKRKVNFYDTNMPSGYRLTRDGDTFRLEILRDGDAARLSLEEKLTQLQKLYETGMINDQEYQRARQMVLDDFADD